MGKYIVQRVMAVIVILFVITVFSFMLIHLLPGDIGVVILGTGDTPENRAKAFKLYGLDKPLIQQYWIWLSHVLRGNLGTSFVSGVPARTTIASALPIDLEIIVMSQVLAFAAAIPLAFRAARKPGGWIDRIATGTTFVLLSIPAFVVIIVLYLVFTVNFHFLSLGTYRYAPGGPLWPNFLAMILPAVTLAIGSFVVYFRVFRADLISTFQEEFITMARSKGLSRRRILWRHAFRPSSISLLATAGINIGGLVAGTFIVEYLSGIPGLGRLLIQAIFTSDYVLVQGIVLTVATIVIILNFVIDLCFGIIDPRISRD